MTLPTFPFQYYKQSNQLKKQQNKNKTKKKTNNKQKS